MRAEIAVRGPAPGGEFVGDKIADLPAQRLAFGRQFDGVETERRAHRRTIQAAPDAANAEVRLQGCIDLGHQCRGVGMRIAAARQWQRRRDSDPEARAFEPLDPQRQHGTIEAERQNREGGSGHCRAAEERHRDAVIHLLVRKQTQMRATAQRRDRLPRGYGALWNEFAPIAAEPRNHTVHQRVVGGSVYLGNRDPILHTGQHADLPVGDMSGEDDHPATGGDRPIDMLAAAQYSRVR